MAFTLKNQYVVFPSGYTLTGVGASASSYMIFPTGKYGETLNTIAPMVFQYGYISYVQSINSDGLSGAYVTFAVAFNSVKGAAVRHMSSSNPGPGDGAAITPFIQSLTNTNLYLGLDELSAATVTLQVYWCAWGG